MAGCIVAILIAISLTTLTIKESHAVCCREGLSKVFCRDCTQRQSLYCGKGSCNIFGCACKGGCKRDCDGILSDVKWFKTSAAYTRCRCRNKRSITDEIKDGYVARAVSFDVTDTNGE